MVELEFKAAENSIQVAGTLNRNTVPRAWKERFNWLSKDSEIELDLAQVNSVDSAGLAMLIQLKAELESSQQTLSLKGANEQLNAFAEMSGVTDLLAMSE